MSTSKITAQNNTNRFELDSIQLKNVYVGLKLGEEYRDNFSGCIEVSKTLNEIIQKQNQELKIYVSEIEGLDNQLKASNEEKLKYSVELESVKNKTVPWYKNPWYYLIIGVTGGMFLAK